MSSGSLLAKLNSSEFSKVLSTSQGFKGFGSSDGGQSGFAGSDFHEVSSSFGSLGSGDTLSFLGLSESSGMGKSGSSKGFSFSNSSQLSETCSTSSGSGGFSFSSSYSSGKSFSSGNSTPVSSQSKKACSDAGHSLVVVMMPDLGTVTTITDIHIGSIVVFDDVTMIVGSPATFSVNLSFSAIVPVVMEGNPRIFSDTSSVVPSGFVRTSSGTGGNDSSWDVASKVVGGGLISGSLEPMFMITGSEEDISVDSSAPINETIELCGEGAVARMTVGIVSTVPLFELTEVSSGMPSDSSLNSTYENPSLLGKVIRTGDVSTINVVHVTSVTDGVGKVSVVVKFTPALGGKHRGSDDSGNEGTHD